MEQACLISLRTLSAPSHSFHQAKRSSFHQDKPQPAGALPSFPHWPPARSSKWSAFPSQFFHSSQQHLGAQESENLTAPDSQQVWGPPEPASTVPGRPQTVLPYSWSRVQRLYLATPAWGKRSHNSGVPPPPAARAMWQSEHRTPHTSVSGSPLDLICGFLGSHTLSSVGTRELPGGDFDPQS